MLLWQSWTISSWQYHIERIWRKSLWGREIATSRYLRLSDCEHSSQMHCWTPLFSRMWTEHLLSKLSFMNRCMTHWVLWICHSQFFPPNDLFLPQDIPVWCLAWTSIVYTASLTHPSFSKSEVFYWSLIHIQHGRSVSLWAFLLLFNIICVKG